MIPGYLLSAFPHRQFHTLPGLLDSWAALPNSNPNACMPMQGGSLYHFYDGLWYDPAERRTHDLPCERRTRYRLSQPDTVITEVTRKMFWWQVLIQCRDWIIKYSLNLFASLYLVSGSCMTKKNLIILPKFRTGPWSAWKYWKITTAFSRAWNPWKTVHFCMVLKSSLISFIWQIIQRQRKQKNNNEGLNNLHFILLIKLTRKDWLKNMRGMTLEVVMLAYISWVHCAIFSVYQCVIGPLWHEPSSLPLDVLDSDWSTKL